MTARSGVCFVIALSAMVAAAGAFSLTRHGYTPDEEFTVFAVRGISAHGLPLLPSGLLYDRGLLYSYTAWLTGALTGADLAAFRAVALACAAATLGVGFALVRRLASPAAGAVAALFVATSVPFWAVATTARFYAPFLLTSVALLLILSRLSRSHPWHPSHPSHHLPHPSHPVAPRRTLAAVLCLAFASRLLHELAFALIALPLVAIAIGATGGDPERGRLRIWTAVCRAMLAGLGIAQAMLMALHFLMPPSDGGGTMIRRFFLWQVLNLFERPAGAPLGVVLAAVVVGLLVSPRHFIRVARAGAVAAFVVIVSASVYDQVTAQSSSTLWHGLAYPLDMFWYLAAAHPLMVWGAFASISARLAGAGGEWPIGERAAHLAWVGWVLWFGVIESGITINYQLLPTVCLLAALALDLVAIGEHTRAIWPGRRAQVIRAVLVGAALLVVADQWRGEGPVPARLAAARPTIEVPGIESVRASLGADDRVFCTDELACLLLIGRADTWLALDDYVRERFVVTRATTRAGVYGGAPAAFSLVEAIAAAPAAARVVVVDVFKEYPVGNSSEWLPRALAAEHLHAHAVLETTQARVVEIRR
ncbi:MAG TPA: glycosyltransferase family 39 protein [Vicinamibacterales bacterium]|nr:glycosyltransferase family 39 protein [Vicinamibacterales bacterium]